MIQSSKNGIRATGKDAQALFDALTAKRPGLPKDIDWIKRHPGMYAVSADQHMLMFSYVEVDEQGRVFQLNHKGERDGFLCDDGWVQDREVRAYHCIGDSPADFVFQRVGEPT